jgi:lipid-A-disaccharide synthase
VALCRVNALRLIAQLLGIGRVTLPNLVLGRLIVPELLQDDLRPEAVAREAWRLLRCGSLRRYTLAGFAECRRALAGPGGGVFSRVAAAVLGDGAEGRRAA